MLFRGMKHRLENVQERKIIKFVITTVTLIVFIHQFHTLLIHSSKITVIFFHFQIGLISNFLQMQLVLY